MRHGPEAEKKRLLSPLGGHRLRQVGPDSGLVHSVQHVLTVHGQVVCRGQHLLFTIFLQRGDGILLGQPHFADQLRHVFVQQLLGAFDLRGDGKQTSQMAALLFCHGGRLDASQWEKQRGKIIKPLIAEYHLAAGVSVCKRKLL